MRPGIVAEGFSLLFEQMPTPHKARPVRVVIILRASFFGLIEGRENTLPKVGILGQHVVFERDYMHDWKITVFAEVLGLFGFRISEQPPNAAAAAQRFF